MPYVLKTTSFTRHFDGFSLSNLWAYLNLRQSYNMDGGSGVDISSMNFPLQLFTYLFRPLPNEAHNTLAFLASLDNVLLLTVFILSIISIIFVKREKLILNHPKENRWFLLIFSLTVLILSSLITSNMGISARQKWMVMPILLYYMFLFMRIK